MHRRFTIAFALLLFAGLATSKEPASEAAANQLLSLRTEFKASSSPIDRLLIASRMARLGDASKYAWIRSEAKSAIAKEAEEPRSRIRIHILDPRKSPYDPSSAQQRATTTGRPRVYTENVEVGPVRDEIDNWRVLALAACIRSDDVEGRRVLRAALDSRRTVIASTAALGLARIRDLKAIDEIKTAAERNDRERLVFVEALVYMNDPSAIAVALDLHASEPVIEELRKAALANGFDPFALDRERW